MPHAPTHSPILPDDSRAATASTRSAGSSDALIEAGRSRSALSGPTMRALLAICLFTYVGQNMLNVSIAPLARALHLAEWIVGLAVSMAAVFVTVLSQFWGRRSVAWGQRKVLLIALSLAVIAGTVFAAAVWARAAGYLGAAVAAAAIVLARGPFFGSAVSAIPPTGQALIAHETPSEAERVRGMAAFSGSIQLSIVIGSVVSSALGSISIFAPVYATPVFVVIALIIGLIWLPRATTTPARRNDAPTAQAATDLPPRVSWLDPRLRAWIASAFGMFFTAGVVQITAGFIVQDRLHLTPQHAVSLTGIMLLANAAGAMVTQLIVVPRLHWSPSRLVRAGITLALIALAVLTVAPSLALMAASTCAVGVANGLVGPGFNAGGSLAVTQAEQGGVAGILNATGALTWIFAPVTATALYGWHPLAPFILALVIVGLSTASAWVFLRPRRRTMVTAR